MKDPIHRVYDSLKPSTVKQLRRSGALTGSPLALGLSLPWLLGRGASLGVVSQVNGMAHPEKTAIIDAMGSVTFSELDALANQTAHALRELGLKPGQRIALLLRNGRHIAQILLAAQKIGVVSCPLNTWGKAAEIGAALSSADPRLVIYDTRSSEMLQEAMHGQRYDCVYVGDGSFGRSFDDIVAEQPRFPVSPFTLRRGSPAVVIHTSGTTGRPKGAARDAGSAGLGSLADLLRVVPYTSDDIVFCPAPIFHSFGLATLTFATVLGATMILPERFDAAEALYLMSEHRATAASLVPVMLRRIVAHIDVHGHPPDLSALHIVLASGSSLGSDLRQRVTEIFGPVLYDLYGSTEAGWVSIADPDAMQNHPESVGRAVPGVKVKVVSSSGEEVPAGSTGLICLKSDVHFEGYLEGEAPKTFGGYMSIGDEGFIDEEGFLFVQGRADDMVVIGGENVYPIEVEAAIDSIPGVIESAVVGIEDHEFGHVLAAFIEGDVTTEQVARYCRDHLAGFKVPRRIEVTAELPRNGTGKVMKKELARQLKPQKDRAPNI